MKNEHVVSHWMQNRLFSVDFQNGSLHALLETNGLAVGKDHQFKGRYDAEKNAVIISLEKDEQSALSPQKCTT